MNRLIMLIVLIVMVAIGVFATVRKDQADMPVLQRIKPLQSDLQHIGDSTKIHSIYIFKNDFEKFNKVVLKDSLLAIIFVGTDFVMIPKRVLAFKNIENLWFMNCTLPDMDSLVLMFKQLKKLKELYFYKTPVPEFPIQFSELTSLKTLLFNELNLNSTPVEGVLPSSIETIEYSNSKIKHFNLSSFPENLVSLEITDCKIRNFCGEIKSNNFEHLKVLNVKLDGLKAKKVIAGIRNCEEITGISIIYCNLTEIPVDLIEMKSLKWIDISGNKISELTDNLLNLSDSTMLWIDENPIRKIPPSLTEWLKKRRIEKKDFIRKKKKFTITDTFYLY
ncbi:MAG TPA: hypothetical protein DCR43_02025 [Bacteroidales bacterium]|nr:MAG: hypothetical protein A2X11_11880 [Bacteroidetes bacterium GWE2_42_24]OFY31038.1 MAG: hypothetical protein A2X09_15830 [Bacteroidetes bacterium GWF2_43_11]HAQ64626.1 hypothetical protein [Bacteroidales bacterium]HBZ66593.1 hypothetical protein [Bacteroidales bacterium]